MPKSYNLNEVSTRLLITEGPRTRSLRFEGEESCEDVYQAHSPRQERPRCNPFVELEEASGSWSMKFSFLVLQLQPTYQQKASGDFPTVLYEVVSKRSSVIEGGLSIDDLNHTLDEISQNMGKQYVSGFFFGGLKRPHPPCRDVQSRIVQRIYNRSTAEEQRWIIRIILKGLMFLSDVT